MSRFRGIPDRRAARSAEQAALWRGATMLLRGVLLGWRLAPSHGPLFVGRGTRVSGARHISHTGRLVIEDGAEVQGLSRDGLRFGSDVSIGARVAIRPTSYYGGDVGEGLEVGDRSSIATGCFVGCSGSVVIGSDVMLGPGVKVFSENHVFSDPTTTIKSQGVERSHVIIEDDCWIGADSIITAGVTIGRGSVIGAGSVVTSDIPPGSVAAGSPARVLRARGAVPVQDAP